MPIPTGSDLALEPRAAPIGHERLDDADTDPALVRRMLLDIARSNRLLGGVRSLERGLELLIDDQDRGRTMHLLDVGTGAGDLPRAATQWALARDITLIGIGLERLPAAARLAESLGTPTVLAAGTQLPLGNDSVDLVLVSQVLHHLDDETAVHLLAEASRVARRGVLVLDLLPSRWAMLAFRLVGPLLGFHPITVADGVTSLARGRRAAHLARLAVQAGAAQPHALELPLARALVAWHS